jgi:Ca2+-binding RTX toxin-like protein
MPAKSFGLFWAEDVSVAGFADYGAVQAAMATLYNNNSGSATTEAIFNAIIAWPGQLTLKASTNSNWRVKLATIGGTPQSAELFVGGQSYFMNKNGYFLAEPMVRTLLHELTHTQVGVLDPHPPSLQGENTRLAWLASSNNSALEHIGSAEQQVNTYYASSPSLQTSSYYLTEIPGVGSTILAVSGTARTESYSFGREYTSGVFLQSIHGGALNSIADIDRRASGYASSSDMLIGDSRANKLYGGNADDYLYGLGGNDLFVGGAGVDFIDGGHHKKPSDVSSFSADTDVADYGGATPQPGGARGYASGVALLGGW